MNFTTPHHHYFIIVYADTDNSQGRGEEQEKNKTVQIFLMQSFRDLTQMMLFNFRLISLFKTLNRIFQILNFN
ncbi:hypothetical protein BpHYR1_018620 [Brachionus plicatilis]|uniref:Uncharacterized protein n=1 Tax=Brachionus plicatilis TaxID=10195 RepID=A0A3M7SJS5_BRAPC|nr:hypothetical protein BpHYR1_018620 [Brachionus plicatilis]